MQTYIYIYFFFPVCFGEILQNVLLTSVLISLASTCKGRKATMFPPPGELVQAEPENLQPNQSLAGSVGSRNLISLVLQLPSTLVMTK